VLLSDTVGFIRDLPHHLVASFRSTLAEARHADLLLHVVDASHPAADQHIETVNRVLEDVGVDSSDPLLVLNKVDVVENRSIVDVLRSRYPHSISVSARARTGLDKLQRAVADRLAAGYLEARVEASVGNGRIHSFLSEHAEVTGTEYHDGRVTFECRIPRRFAGSLVKAGADVRTLDGASVNGKDEGF
jgi:GTP-binding protein HflX